MESLIIIIIAVLALIISTIFDPNKSLKALKLAGKRLIAFLPSFLTMLAVVSIILTLIPRALIAEKLSGENILLATLLASVIGSVTLMPGFIAFPLSGILLSQGVAYMVLSAFTTSLMMVGVVTYPIEKQYFGTKVTVIRNVLSFLTAMVIAIITGLYFGEVFI